MKSLKEIKAAIKMLDERVAHWDKKGMFVDSRIAKEKADLLRWAIEEEQDSWDDDFLLQDME